MYKLRTWSQVGNDLFRLWLGWSRWSFVFFFKQRQNETAMYDEPLEMPVLISLVGRCYCHKPLLSFGIKFQQTSCAMLTAVFTSGSWWYELQKLSWVHSGQKQIQKLTTKKRQKKVPTAAVLYWFLFTNTEKRTKFKKHSKEFFVIKIKQICLQFDICIKFLFG